MVSKGIRPVEWVGSSYKDFCSFPDPVQDIMGFALYQAQIGHMHTCVKPLKGFGSATVLEIVDDYKSDTYRVIYTVKFENAIYVLHAFQKKSKTGIKTPQHEIELIKRRLRTAEEDHKSRPRGPS